MKKLISLVLLLSMLLGTAGILSGCNNAPKTVEEGATVITLYAQNFELWSNEYLQKRVDEFNQIMDDGIQLEVKFFTDSAYNDAITVARENGTGLDLYMVSYGNLWTDVEYGRCVPLNDLLDQACFDDLTDAAKELVVYDGKYYAYPTLIEASALLFYRKDLLESAGVTQVPTTWEELYAACDKLKGTLNAAQYPLGLPTGQALGWATWGMQYNTTGGLVLDDTWQNVRIEDAGYKQLAEFFYTCYKNGYAPAQQLTAKGYNDIIEALCQSKLAMTVAGSWSVAEIFNTYPSMVDKIGVAELPTFDGNRGGITATNGGWSYAIDSTSKNQEKAAQVIYWMFCENAQRTAGFFEAAHYSKTAVNKSVQEYIDNSEKVVDSEWLDVITKVAGTAKPEPLFSWDVTVAVMKLFDTVSIYATSSDFDSLYDSALATCKSDIQSVFSRSNIGSNPRIEDVQ